jgi:choline dehydrogenase-like flavoprotein
VNAEFVRRNFTFETIMEPVPNPESRVSLSPERDRLGLNRVRLDWRLTKQDERNFETITTLLTDDLVRQGVVTKVSEWPDRNVTGCWHHMGTTRMHTDPAKGVVDAGLKVHGISNLYCAGSSVFPTVGSDCPTISLVALALRLADTLACLF